MEYLMRTYIVRGFNQNGDYRLAVIVTTPEEIHRKVEELQWSQVTEPELAEDHMAWII